MPRTVDGAPASARDAAPTPSTLLSKRAGPMRQDRIKTGFEKRQYSVGSNLLAGKVLPYLYCLFSKNSEKTEQVTVSDTRRLVSKNNNTTSYHRPDPSSGTMLPEVIARLYDGARPWSSIAEDQGRGGNTGAVNVR